MRRQVTSLLLPVNSPLAIVRPSRPFAAAARQRPAHVEAMRLFSALVATIGLAFANPMEVTCREGIEIRPLRTSLGLLIAIVRSIDTGFPLRST
ncbi:hypothetical protein CA85_47370 [Allorhodopirellula solitaria]|uniref:Uncharacterized protein n=1 Tax=Allorhodopirellula solitaria TaxID=2527987 RepID=A0A5C5X196_9BACT|nr:hypothetical protein CA85_47370 [Allorhodopirellula solitaria]